MLHRPTLVILLALSGTGSALAAQAPAKRPIQSSDLFRLRAIGDPQRSPDGAWVAYTVTRADSAKDKSDTDIWLSRWDGSATVRLTFSEESETQPGGKGHQPQGRGEQLGLGARRQAARPDRQRH